MLTRKYSLVGTISEALVAAPFGAPVLADGASGTAAPAPRGDQSLDASATSMDVHQLLVWMCITTHLHLSPSIVRISN